MAAHRVAWLLAALVLAGCTSITILGTGNDVAIQQGERHKGGTAGEDKKKAAER